jgi:arabinofuranosyltransferase
MISMRYGWNLAHGLGLVWNAGQRVEGYSNLLMTLAMSLAALVLDKPLAVLAIQLMGIPTVLLAAALTWKLARGTDFDGGSGIPSAILAFLCVLLYYPLSYWTLMGMESGLVTLFLTACIWFGLRWLQRRNRLDLAAMAAASALAFLTRNDSILLTGLVFAYMAWEIFREARDRVRELAFAGLAVVVVVAAQTVFRYLYYGSPLPNTYTLKLTGFPLYIRLLGGTRFALEFLRQSWMVLALAALGVALSRRRRSALLAAIVLVAVAYQIYVGGDPWPSWRMLASAMPSVFLLAIDGTAALVGRLKPLRRHAWARGTAIGVLVCGIGPCRRASCA